MLQQFHQAFSQTQAHLVDCRSHFFQLANGSLSNNQYISNNCADILNPTLIKQMMVAGVLPTLKHVTQNQNIDWNTMSTTVITYYIIHNSVHHVNQVSVFCMPVKLPSLVWYNWCIW